ncbi:DUF4845 domain-containing protein [Pseudomonadales bacterium]|jgi:signal transduction histidine kinase|nr:DUF4845 domain-containing protein [Pseudomonadales bacterium]MDC1314587.1 DUF4845 domain-containing protein [Pseudomonadales bacterium]
MTSVRKAQGLAFSEILIWLTIMIVLASIATKFVPAYLDHQTAVSIVGDFAQSSDMDVLSVSELEEILARRFQLNNLQDFVRENRLKIKNRSGRLEAVLQYEVRGDLAVNIDYVITFDDSIRLDD